MTADAPHTPGYAEERARDWEQFRTSSEPLRDYWAQWEGRSYGWRVPIEFLQPVGLEAPHVIEPLRPLLDALGKLDEVNMIPIEWLHVTPVHVGFMRPTGIMWSQVENFYVNAAPRLHRIPPFTMRFGGISATEDGVYLGVDDGLSFREVRRQCRLGVPEVFEAMKDDPLVTPDGDRFVPRMDLAFFTGRGDRSNVIKAIEPYLDAEAGEQRVTHVKMARIPIQPNDHYSRIDVVAEIELYGESYRKGYHN